MNPHIMFIQNFYEECPNDVMVGTIECPAFLFGYIWLNENKEIERFEISPYTAMFVRKYVNIFVEDVGLFRNIYFDKAFDQNPNQKLLLSSKA